MQVRNVSPLGDLYVPALGREVKADELVDVEDEIGERLCEQSSNWAAVAPATGKKG